MHLTESQREKAFPIHLEMGKEMPDMEMSDEMDEKPKKKKFYPVVFISDIPGLEHLPEEGCVLMDYKRRSLTVREQDGETQASVELEIRTLCLPEEYGEEDADDVVESLTKKAFKKKEDDEEDND